MKFSNMVCQKSVVDTMIEPWAKAPVTAELGRRLELVAKTMHAIIARQGFSAAFNAQIEQALRQHKKLLASKAASGHPVISEDRGLWSFSVILAHAAASDTGSPGAPLSSWQTVTPVAAAAEFLGLALDLIDDVQDGDASIVEQLGMPLVLNIALALLGLVNVAIADPQTPVLLRDTLHTMFASAMLAATEGQFLDIDYEHKQQVTTNECLEMTAKKSGSLVGLLFQAGAFVGFSTKMDVDHAASASADFAEFGHLLGIIAQLENDLQDAFPSDSINKKSDRTRAKKTLPLVFEAEYLEKSESSVDEMREATLRFVQNVSEIYRIQALDALATLTSSHNIHPGILRWLITNREAFS